MDFHAQSNISFIRHKIHELEKFTEKKRPFTRLVFSKEFYEARVWLKDESKAFETTDAAIEKSVNLAFELLSQGPLDSIIDFGRFALKTKFI